jgi:hypothetical protein
MSRQCPPEVDMTDAELLAQRLCVMVGTMMEDASPAAVSSVNGEKDLRSRVEYLLAVSESCRDMMLIAGRLVVTGK